MNRVVLDTSIWIEYFKSNPFYFESCQKLIDQRLVLTHEVIFAELIQGAKGNRELKILDTFYQNLPKAENKDLVYVAGLFSQKHQLFNKGIGLIDSIIILSTLENQCQLWTLDGKIIRFLEEFYPTNIFQNSSI